MSDSDVCLAHWIRTENGVFISLKLIANFIQVTWMSCIVIDHFHSTNVKISSDIPKSKLSEVLSVFHNPFCYSGVSILDIFDVVASN